MTTNRPDRPNKRSSGSEKKYFYISRVGLTIGSWALKKFEDDAERHHMLDQPGKLAAIRLTEYYELLERLNAVPGAIVPTHADAQPTSNGNGRSAATTGRHHSDEGAATEQQPDDDSFDDDVDHQWDMGD